MSAPQHVIFGAGAIGTTLAETLLGQGESGIRLVSRSGRGSTDDRIEAVAGDAGDSAFAAQVAAGSRVVYQVLNPRYDQWAARFPQLQRSVLGAAQAAGARLVSMENVYLYGRPSGHPFVETDPALATTRKGRLRAQMADQLLDAHRAGRVEVAIGRASDYYGPRGGAQSVLGDRALDAVLAGKVARVLGDPAQPHTFTYIPDIARGLAVLGREPGAAGRVWHLPNDPAPLTTAQLLGFAAKAAGLDAPTVRTLPVLLLRAAGLFNPIIRELLEMQYEFEEPFLVSSDAMHAAFGITATPYEEGLARTMHEHRRSR